MAGKTDSEGGRDQEQDPQYEDHPFARGEKRRKNHDDAKKGAGENFLGGHLTAAAQHHRDMASP